ncbi:MAG: hypothetical protein LBC82_08990 [Oscillospiraceae bacterium]|jgi:hypothetical protein|nr:hypothetical protein [Oscillospiraceae bacterium]
MIDVSREYMEKSLAPGRNVACKILADDFIYTDADILSFEFNDVIHPDDMNFGTTCANRFQVELWSRRNIPLSAVIRPFVGFKGESSDEGNAEYCRLGEFYITRRYRKRERYSVTCYDRMYRLDTRYRPSVSFPCSAAELLSDIAEMYRFEAGFKPEADVIESVPRMATCREVIGYIAGINGGFAKFDRDGVLRLKKLELCDFTLNRSHYSELSIKADKLEIRQIDFIADEETFSAGRGTKLTTYRHHNPFADKKAAERVFNHWNGFAYHGMTVKMQGLPFLESGESIYVQDDFENEYYLALISDYTLEYDGGLRGRLTSRSKNPIDDYDEPMTQQRMMESLNESLRVRFFNYTNERNITIARTTVPMLSINFHLETNSFIAFNSQFNITSDSDCIMTLNYHINNIKVGQEPRLSLSENSPASICLYNCFERIRLGRNTLTVTASLNSGSAVIETGGLIASVSGQYMLSEVMQKPEINVEQSIGRFELSPIGLKVRGFSGIPEEPAIFNPINETASENLGLFSIAPLNLKTRTLEAAPSMDAVLVESRKISDTQILLRFTNIVLFTGEALDPNGFNVGDGFNTVAVHSGEIVNNNSIILTTENLNALDIIIIVYNSTTGNLINIASESPVNSFNYVLN